MLCVCHDYTAHQVQYISSQHSQDEALLRSAMAFYRLMAAWLLRLSSPAAAAGADPEMPLPTPPPDDMRFLPV